tara:strand:+ start:17644 stop:17976 length:333 start_codon:yes stop_codon:yes gene_type:complete
LSNTILKYNNSKENNLHKWEFEDIFEEIKTYERFLNWISGEFTLYLQEDIDYLNIHFPNGWFSIIILDSNNNNNVHFKIEVKSKCFKKGAQIFSKVKSILTHIKKIQIQN